MAYTLNRLGIKVVYDVIFNNPYESREDVLETIRMLLSFPPPFSVQGFNLIFYPGTTLTEKALKDGFITEKDSAEDFSTIEGKADSPIAMTGNAGVSSRFYAINYSSEQKKYLNTVITLMAHQYIPRGIIRFFGRSETPFKRTLLNLFTKCYYNSVVRAYLIRQRMKASFSCKAL
jgi:hypothetical protein